MFSSASGLGFSQSKRGRWTLAGISFVVFLIFLVWFTFSDVQTHRQTTTGHERTRRNAFYDIWTYTREAEQLMCGSLAPPVAFPYFCYNSNQTMDVLIIAPKGNFKHNHWGTASEWQGYHWYIRGLSGDEGWGSIFRSTAESSWEKGTFGWTPQAQQWSTIISNFTVSDSFFTFRVNTTGQPFPTPTKGYITFCSRLLICAWANGKDPCWQFMFCPDFNATTPTPVRTVSGVGPARQVKIIEGTPSPDNWFQAITGISADANNWLLMVEQAANTTNADCLVCMGPRPLLKVVPATVTSQCIADIMVNSIPNKLQCNDLNQYYPVVPSEKGKPIFDRKVAKQNFSCFEFSEDKGIMSLGKIDYDWCNNIQTFSNFKPISRADLWIWCGTDQIFDRLPMNVSGRCALISLLLPVYVQPVALSDFLAVVEQKHDSKPSWRKRSTHWNDADPTYIDALGVPRGVPDEYKLVNQVAAGFESIFLWVTPNKNVDRINYIHYNVQKLGNYTIAGFEAVHEQLKATSLMAFQNRIALDMLLAEKSGVCGIFGDQCCSFIPNNTQSDGKLTVAIEGMRTLNNKMKEHAGIDTSMWGDWLKMFGPWKTLVSSVLVAGAVFSAILTLCGCCCIPCLRTLMTRLIEQALGEKVREYGQYAMLPVTLTGDDKCGS
uniref:Uncharacterized protein n=1 Tax=Oryzias latipes TaxID=8090 RepID=A0A3B3IK00_ORYLA